MAKKIKKCWVIERKYEFSEDKKLLAIFSLRTSYEKIILAMKTLMMAGCDSYKNILDITALNKDDLASPHQYGRYPIIIAEGQYYYKAPYKAWITELNTETGEYKSIDEKYKDYIDSGLYS